MKIKFQYILLFMASFMLSLSAQGIEINSDSFVKADSEEEEEEDNLELLAPNMGRAYKKEKVMIKRDLSALDSALDSAEEERSLKSQESRNTVPEKKTAERTPASHRQSVDYGDSEVHWHRQ